jgi:hypothetical protein
MANQTSKIMSTRSSVCGVAFFFVSSVGAIAGSAAGGGAQIAPNDNTPVSTYKATDTSVGASARDSAGASASQVSGSSSTNASSTDAASTNASSSNGAASSNGGAPSGYGISPRAANNSNNISKEIAREKVIDTGDKAIDTDKSAKVESRDKTFAPGLLDKVSDISAVSAQKEHASGSKAGEGKSAALEAKNDSHK